MGLTVILPNGQEVVYENAWKSERIGNQTFILDDHGGMIAVYLNDGYQKIVPSDRVDGSL